MGHVNVEFKARMRDPERVRSVLRQKRARRVGVDHQIDTYFHALRGRLKLREGNLERALIYYERQDAPSARRSDVTLYTPAPGTVLKDILTRALGVKTVVEKYREIFFVENVKIHVDRVRGLGEFVEVEAIDESGQLNEQALRDQCEEFLELFGVLASELVGESYSDLPAGKISEC